MIHVGDPRSTVAARLLESGNASRQLGAIVRAGGARFQNAGAEIFGYELKLVGGEAAQETKGRGSRWRISTRNQGGYQGIPQTRSPVGEKPYDVAIWSVLLPNRKPCASGGCGRPAIAFLLTNHSLPRWTSAPPSRWPAPFGATLPDLDGAAAGVSNGCGPAPRLPPLQEYRNEEADSCRN